MSSSPSKPQTLALTLTTSSLFPNPTPLPPLPSHIPPSHLIPSTRFLVDAFRFCGAFSRSYFLSHFHSDHYSGLTSSWRKGIIFCSRTTSKLLVQVLKLPASLVFPLPLDETVGIDGCEVTAVDANHCPGAVVFLFRVPVGGGEGFRRYVHTGDFRFCESMRENEFVRRFIGTDAVFLDTTYCHPKFKFPAQDESVDYVARTVERVLAERKGFKEKVLVLIGTYVVGKERILVEVSRRCGCLVHVDGRKMEVLRVLGYGDSGFFTEDASLTDVHVVGWNVLGETWPFFRPNFVKMGEITKERGYTKAVGFVPTGWMYEMRKDGFTVRAKDLLEIHLVPYSEHSSYNELREFVGFLRPMRVIPTVGLDVDKLDSKHALSMQKHFASLVDETANKHQFLAAFKRAASDSGEKVQSDMYLESDKDANVQGDDDENKDYSPDKETHYNNERSDMDLESGGNVPGDEDENRDNTLYNIVDKSSADLEGTIYELSKSLPSWTTKEQMVDLLTRSTGDVVEAVSEFYEHETELFEQANASTSTSQMDSTSKVVPCAIFPNACIDLNNNAKSISIRKGMTNKDIAISKNMSPKKIGQPLGSRSKKKGKKPTSKLDGSKQVTITKFFNKSPSGTSEEVSFGSCTTEKQLVEKLHHPCDPPEPCEDRTDQFLRIVNFDIPRNNAISLLEKAKGNLDAALDLYYSVPSSNALEKDLSSNCNSEMHSQGSLVTNFTKGIAKSSKVTGDTVMLAAQTERNKNQSAAFLLLPLEKYSAAQHACWEAGEPAPYLHLARTFDLVEQEKGKIKTTNILCNMFRSLLTLSPEDVLSAVYLCTNKIAPDHENMELNIGFGMVTAALEETCGTSRSKLRDMYNDLGDLGDVALICRQTQALLVPPHPLSIKTLFSSFRKISVETGAGCATRKKSIIISLLQSCREKEIKFVVRTLVRNLRIGAMLRTVLPSLAQAVVLSQSFPEHQEENVDRLKTKLQEVSTAVVEAYNIVPNLDLLIPTLLSSNIGFSPSSLALVPGMPIPPMLARVTNGIPQVLKSFNGRAFTCEFKYDGQRAQIHRQMDGIVRVFSRNMGETTSKFPDLVEVIQDLCKHVSVDKTFILDSEVVAVDRKNNNKLMAFQHLSSRERGGKNYSVRLDNLRVDICIFVFDMMFYNGKQLLGFPLRQRRKFLKDLILEEKPGYLEFAKEMTVEADEAIEGDHNRLAKLHSFLEHACTSSCEGIMVKSLDIDANYAASKRTESWLKVKRDYVEGLGDSLDLVPIGAWYGNGRKAKWYSPFLMACYNHDNEEFQSVCRVMSGFSDSFYAEMKEFFSGDKVLPKKPPYYQTDEKPDLWFSSELVWEIRGAEFSISPVHYASIGMVHPSRGISIRFPRYAQTVSDKRPEDCTTATEIADMYRSQSRKMGVDTPE